MIDILKNIEEQLEEKQAEDVIILDISKISSISEYFIIASADNERKVKAIANHIEEYLCSNGFNIKVKEGFESAKWILLDFGDIIIHIFDNEEREYYNLEKIWRDGIKIN